MGNRLSKIYTRTGDDGSTGLGDGERVRKDSLRVESFGTIDELNSAIGVMAAANMPAEFTEIIADIQQQLFDLGGELCIPGSVVMTTDTVDDLETLLDKLNAGLEPLKDFILPGGTPAGAACHLARAICRRAERRVISLAAADEAAQINPVSIRYLNRLSDFLFVLARVINDRDDNAEILWTGGKLRHH